LKRGGKIVRKNRTALLILSIAITLPCRAVLHGQERIEIPPAEVKKIEDVERAIKNLEKAVRIYQSELASTRKDSPEYKATAFNLAKASEGLGTAYIRASRFEEALSVLNKAISLGSESGREFPDALQSRAIAYSRLGRAAEAIIDLEKLVKMRDRSEVRTELAFAYAKAGRPDDAIAQYRVLIKGRPDDAWSLFQMGFLLAEKGQYSDAAKAYEDALVYRDKLATSTVATVYGNLGDAYYHLCDRTKSLAAFEKALELEPENPQFLVNVSAADLMSCRP
jgi:tetratricopeptide (TPR) repeat protein